MTKKQKFVNKNSDFKLEKLPSGLKGNRSADKCWDCGVGSANSTNTSVLCDNLSTVG